MNEFDQQWQKLAALARRAGDAREVAAPHGFATRVAARAGAMLPHSAWAPFEYFALRGLMVAAVLGVVAVVFNYTTLTTGTQADAYATAETVDELLDLS